MYQGWCVVLLLVAATMFNRGEAEPKPPLGDGSTPLGGAAGGSQTGPQSMTAMRGGGSQFSRILSSRQWRPPTSTPSTAYTSPRTVTDHSQSAASPIHSQVTGYQSGLSANERDDIWKQFDSQYSNNAQGYHQTTRVPHSSSIDEIVSSSPFPNQQSQHGSQPLLPQVHTPSKGGANSKPLITNNMGNPRTSSPANAGHVTRLPSSVQMQSSPQSDRRGYISGNPPHLFKKADQVAEKYRNPGDENPDKWVTHNAQLDTLPESVILPLIYDTGMVYATMTVGTAHPDKQEQKLKVLFDTGSTQLWILTKESCRTQTCPVNAKPFDPTASKTYKSGTYTLKTTYGSGLVDGTFGEDTVTLEDSQAKIVVKEQMIGEAQTRRGVLDRYEVLCGMSLVAPPLMGKDPYSFLYTMIKQYGTTLPFGFYTNKYDPSQSKMIFGEGYQDYIVGDLNTHNVHPVPYEDIGRFYNGWYVKFDGWVLEAPGKKTVYLPVDKEMFALVDTGASTQSGPQKMMHDLNEKIFSFATFEHDNSKFTLDCKMDTRPVFQQLPDVSAVIDGIKYPIPPWDYIVQQEGTCRPAFVYIDQKKDHVVLGRPFMSIYFTRFDHRKKTVQFGVSKQDLEGEDAQYHLGREKRRWGDHE